MTSLIRSRWAAIGAAIAVTLGGGGLIGVSASNSSSTLVPVAPVRVLDTRSSDLVGHIDNGATITVQITGAINTVSEGTETVVPVGASAVIGNLTLTETSANNYGGFATIYPCGTRPDASNINFTSNQTVANAVAVPLSSTGTVCIYVYGTAHVLFDVSGYYTKSEISDLADRVSTLEGVTASSDLAERVTTLEQGAVELPSCEWYEKVVAVDGALECSLGEQAAIMEDALGNRLVLWGSTWVDENGLEYTFKDDGTIEFRSGSPDYLNTWTFYATEDCSGTRYLPTDPNLGTTLYEGSAFEGKEFVIDLFTYEWRLARIATNPTTDSLHFFRLDENSFIPREDALSYSQGETFCGAISDPSSIPWTNDVFHEIVWLEESPVNQFQPPLTLISSGRSAGAVSL